MPRITSIVLAACLLAGSARHAVAAPAGFIDASIVSQVELVQEKPKKSETLTQKVKRVWRNVTTPNYNFCVACPVLLPLSRTTCTAQAKTVDEARGKCAAQYPLCSVVETKKGC
jgi:hypothetical protein